MIELTASPVAQRFRAAYPTNTRAVLAEIRAGAGAPGILPAERIAYATPDATPSTAFPLRRRQAHLHPGNGPQTLLTARVGTYSDVPITGRLGLINLLRFQHAFPALGPRPFPGPAARSKVHLHRGDRE
jgi:hypothetical protein